MVMNPATKNEMVDWLWLVKTDKGDFFVTVFGKWTQEEAARRLRVVFAGIQLDIIAMIPRKRATGSDDALCTIYEDEKVPLGFSFMASKRLWEACGRRAEYDAELVRVTKEIE